LHAKQPKKIWNPHFFQKFGELKSVKIIKDLYSGESKGFGFVEMKDKSEGETAIKELNAYELNGKKIVVNEARPKSNIKRGGGHRGNGGNRGGFGGGGKRR
jgi:RNA recognition motif-containing protein